MPQYIPPQAPPVAQQQQDQNQQQGQNSDINVNDKSSTESTSKSDNKNNLTGSLSNVQINNNNTGTHTFEYGVKIPTTTLTIGGWANENDHGGQVFLTIPLGGSTTKLAKRQINTRVRQMNIENNARALKVCDNMANAGYEILDYEALGLEHCKFVKKVSQSPVANAQDETKAMLQTIQQQKAMIEALMKRLDQMSTEKGTEFKTNG